MTKTKITLTVAFVAGVVITAVFQEYTKAKLRLEIATREKHSNDSTGEERHEATSGGASGQTKAAAIKAPNYADQADRSRRRAPIINKPISGGLIYRGWLPASALRDAGRADVPSAVETMLWGQAHSETTALASTMWVTMAKNPTTGKDQWVPTILTPDSAEVVTAGRVSKREPFSEVQVIEQVGSGNNAYVTIEFRTSDGSVHQQRRRFHVTGDGWKWVPSSEQLAAAQTDP